MTLLLAIHILGGSLAIVSGFIAIFAVKGLELHRRSGVVFLYSMLALGFSGAVIATIRSQPGNFVGGMLAVYMVSTGVLTLRPRDRAFFWLYAAAAAFALGISYFSLTNGLQARHNPTGRIHGVPSQVLFTFAGITVLAALSDLRVMLVGGLQGRRRLVRHLWRMSFSLFVATGSFFLGQAKVIPKPIRFWPALFTLAFLPLAMLIYWLVRVLFTKWYRRRGTTFVQPTPIRSA
jgi:hypothetical protein